MWIDPKLLIAGRKEEMEYMMKIGVFEVVDEKECYDNGCKPLMLKWVDKRRTIWASRRIFIHAAVGRVEDFLLEGHEQVGMLSRLCRSMHGKRDAASIWRDTWSEVLKEGSMKVGTACPAFFCSCDGDFKGLCHGADFCVVETTEAVANFWKRN